MKKNIGYLILAPPEWQKNDIPIWYSLSLIPCPMNEEIYNNTWRWEKDVYGALHLKGKHISPESSSQLQTSLFNL